MKKSWVITTFLAGGLFAIGCTTQPLKSESLIPNWQPNINQPIEQLEEILSQLEQQQPMNYTISNVAFLYDAKLYILFGNFITVLPKSERTYRISEQNKWLKKREELIRLAYAEYEGGTLASYSSGKMSIDFTKKRITEIENKMTTLPTKALKAPK